MVVRQILLVNQFDHHQDFLVVRKRPITEYIEKQLSA